MTANVSRSGWSVRIASSILVLAALLLAYTVVTTGLSAHQFDQAAANGTPTGRTDTSFLARLDGEFAIDQAEFARAHAAARKALKMNPRSVESLRVFAISAERLGRETEAARAFAMAGEMSWRDYDLSASIADQALKAGDARRAAQHFDALLRQNPDGPAIEAFTSIALDEDTRMHAVQRLSEDPPWRRQFYQALARRALDQPERAKNVLLALRKVGSPPKADELSRYVNHLYDKKNYNEAHEVWREFRGAEANRFLQPDSQIGKDVHFPFEWNVKPVPGLESTPTPVEEGGKGGLRLAASSTVVGAVLTKDVVLPPGTFALKSRMIEEASRSSDSFKWRATCVVGGNNLAVSSPRAAGKANETISLKIQVPSSCPVVRLALWADHQGPRTAGLQLKNVALVRAP